MQYSKSLLYKKYAGIESSKDQNIPPYARNTRFAPTRHLQIQQRQLPSASGGMAPIIEKEDEEYELNKLNFLVCENVKHLVEFSLEMLSNYSQLKQIFGQN